MPHQSDFRRRYREGLHTHLRDAASSLEFAPDRARAEHLVTQRLLTKKLDLHDVAGVVRFARTAASSMAVFRSRVSNAVQDCTNPEEKQ